MSFWDREKQFPEEREEHFSSKKESQPSGLKQYLGDTENNLFCILAGENEGGEDVPPTILNQCWEGSVGQDGKEKKFHSLAHAVSSERQPTPLIYKNTPACHNVSFNASRPLEKSCDALDKNEEGTGHGKTLPLANLNRSHGK